MQAQEYMVKDVQYWKDDNGEPIQDQWGNYKLSLSLSGFGEPVDMTAKNVPEVGTTEYGKLEEYTTKAGKIRTKFVRESKEEAAPASSSGTKSTWQPKNEAQVTLNMVWKNMLTYWDMKLLTDDPEEFAKFFAAVKQHADELLLLGEKSK